MCGNQVEDNIFADIFDFKIRKRTINYVYFTNWLSIKLNHYLVGFNYRWRSRSTTINYLGRFYKNIIFLCIIKNSTRKLLHF